LKPTLILLHGWSVQTTAAYGLLAPRLAAAGYPLRNIFLGRYLSLDGRITLDDLVEAFDAALDQPPTGPEGGNPLRGPFSLIGHSTGGLLAWAWTARYSHLGTHPRPREARLRHLITLATPHHGSRLAHHSLAMFPELGRTDFPYARVLDDLELGSERLWDMTRDWIRRPPAGRDGFFPFSMAGGIPTPGSSERMMPAQREPGSDGLVRIPSANPNTRCFRLATGAASLEPRGNANGTPFRIFWDRSHTDPANGLLTGIPAEGPDAVVRAVLDCLEVQDAASYERLLGRFEEESPAPAEGPAPAQLVVQVTDHHGNPCADKRIALFPAAPESLAMAAARPAPAWERSLGPAIRHVHQNRRTPHRLVFLFDFPRLEAAVAEQGGLGVRVDAATATELARLLPAQCILPAAGLRDFLRPGETTLLEVVLTRKPAPRLVRLIRGDVPGQPIQWDRDGVLDADPEGAWNPD